MRKLLLGGFLIAAIFALTACGGGESDEDQIISAIETAALSEDPESCTELQTLAFTSQTEAEDGKAAVKECEEDAESEGEGEDPDSVAVEEVEIDGSSATANATFSGGNLDQQTLTIGLVEEDGTWKLDRLEGFVGFNKDRFVGAFSDAISGSDELNEEQVSCIVEEMEASSDEELEELVLSGSPEDLVAIIESCE